MTRSSRRFLRAYFGLAKSRDAGHARRKWEVRVKTCVATFAVIHGSSSLNDNRWPAIATSLYLDPPTPCL